MDTARAFRWLAPAVFIVAIGWSATAAAGDLSWSIVVNGGSYRYEDERVLEGTVPVRLSFAADVQPGPIELIGRVDHEGEQFALEATSIRRLAPSGNR